jgi:hypothetical protein
MADPPARPYGPEAVPAPLRRYAERHGKRYSASQLRDLLRLASALDALERAVRTMPPEAPLRALADRAVDRFFNDCRAQSAGIEAHLLRNHEFQRIAAQQRERGGQASG